MPYAKYSPEEVESRGEEIYEQEIRQNVEAGLSDATKSPGRHAEK